MLLETNKMKKMPFFTVAAISFSLNKLYEMQTLVN